MTDPPADRHPQPEDESTRWLGKTDQWRSDMLTDQDKDFAERPIPWRVLLDDTVDTCDLRSESA